jgi:hypothetical protein
MGIERAEGHPGAMLIGMVDGVGKEGETERVGGGEWVSQKGIEKVGGFRRLMVIGMVGEAGREVGIERVGGLHQVMSTGMVEGAERDGGMGRVDVDGMTGVGVGAPVKRW